jgi:hypothetical protein
MWASLVTQHMSHLTGNFTSIRPIVTWYNQITAYVIVLYLFSGHAETDGSGKILEYWYFYLLSMENQKISNI